jgi:hypothetical protein
LSALLVLCDEIQEWLRPSYGMSALAESTYARMNWQQSALPRSRRVCEGVWAPGCKVANGRVVWASTLAASSPTIRLRYADQNVNVFEPLSRLMMKLYNLERIQGINQVRLRLEIEIPWLGAEPAGVQKRISELGILCDFALLSEVGISGELLRVHSKPPRKRCRCCCYRHQSIPNMDVVCLDFAKFERVPRERPLIARPPWEFEKQLHAFKREYCRKMKVRCTYFEESDEWTIRQLPEVRTDS